MNERSVFLGSWKTSNMKLCIIAVGNKISLAKTLILKFIHQILSENE